MQTYLVSYDLSAPHRDYARVSEAIKSYGTWAKVLESVWLISAEKSATEVRDHLKRHVDSDDKLVVVAVTRGWATSNVSGKNVTTWMHNHIA